MIVKFNPVTQTEFRDDEAGTHGNCLSACLSAITGIELDEIPNFAKPAKVTWFVQAWEWADANGFEIGTVAKGDLCDGIYVVTGEGPRGHTHACLWAGGPDGMIAWDPHPSRDGLLMLEHWLYVEPEASTGVGS